MLQLLPPEKWRVRVNQQCVWQKRLHIDIFLPPKVA